MRHAQTFFTPPFHPLVKHSFQSSIRFNHALAMFDRTVFMRVSQTSVSIKRSFYVSSVHASSVRLNSVHLSTSNKRLNQTIVFCDVTDRQAGRGRNLLLDCKFLLVTHPRKKSANGSTPTPEKNPQMAKVLDNLSPNATTPA